MPVEILNSIGAGRRAITAPDTAVIDLSDKPLIIDIRRIDGADLGTGGVITMHAGPWKEPRFDMGILSLNVRDQFNPMDGATLGRFVRSDDGDIVFRLTSDHTGLTSGTSI
jgi:hypothetical protein